MVAKQKRQRASQKKKEKIMQATMQLLLKKGSSTSVSTSDICAAAYLTRPTLYHYFKSKRNLLLAVHIQSIESGLRPYLKRATSIVDPLERLVYMIHTYTKEIICLHPELRVLIYDALIMKDKNIKNIRLEWKSHYLLLKETIAQLQLEGKIPSDVRPSWVALFVLGMLTWITYWLDYTKKSSIDSLVEEALQFILKGIGIKNIDTIR